MRVEFINIADINCDGPYVDVPCENSILAFADSVAKGRPIVVHEGSQKRGYKYNLVCGFHRVAAAEHVGIKKIWAVIVQNVNEVVKPDLVVG